ncbi:hypothetical protein T05_1211 [Trichinella murrelli]|uniref:Uncharacterized protein n=1 Tax=Trichinella murrelli TaxID=144512 RepID=A0A0V0TDG4_9BILA|nr:hypothetical protein T05_1211 [Trichinella murrelli]
MPSGKREAERKGNLPVSTALSPSSDVRANKTMEDANEPARGSESFKKLDLDGLLSISHGFR